MSSFSREFLASKLPKLPPLPSSSFQEADEEDDEERSASSLSNDTLGELASPGTSPAPRRARKAREVPHPALDAVPSFFERVSRTTPVASSPSLPPLPSFQTYYTPPRLPQGETGSGSVAVLHHGGGEGALGWAAMAKEVRSYSSGELGVLAFDCRGHGDTSNPADAGNPLDLSLQTLTSDLVAFLQTFFPDPKKAPAFVMVGHSMGAAPVVESTPLLQALGYKVSGVAVLDVVEGAAIESLPLMPQIIAGRPSTFASTNEAIDWHISTQTYRTPLSAQLSVPSILQPLPSPSTRVTWQTDLLASQPFWESWYTGLSGKFVAVRSARMLVLAGTDRIDKELMIAQMQGKFQHVVLPHCGHHIQQDVPERLAELLCDFWHRNEGVNLKNIRKVGQA